MQRILPVFLITFFGYVGYSLVITIFTPLLLQEKGRLLSSETPTEIRVLALGFLLACYPFGQFFSSPVLGALSDRFGRRPILLYSLVVTTIIYFVIAYGIAINSFLLVAFSLIVAGLSEGNTTLAQGVIADVVPKKERGRLFGFLYLSAAVAFIVGPLVGGKLANSDLVSWFSYKTPFIFIGFLLFGTFLWFLFSFKETHPPHRREHIPYLEAFTNLKNIFLNRLIRPYFFANFLIFLGIFGFFQGFPIYIVTRFSISVTLLGIFIAWSSVPFLVVNIWLIGPLSKKFTPQQLLIASALWIGIFLELALLPTALWTLWFFLFFIGLGIALCLPSCTTLLSHAVTQKEQGRVLGNNLSLQFFSEAFVGIVIGFLASLFLKTTIVLFGLMSIIGGLIHLYLSRRKALH
ncbi:MAG: Multidrug resistance protein MdtG [Chlamydiales bacterium]|nr:Multidrug resistance protein MdtG [Chlamydiales bacterium]